MFTKNKFAQMDSISNLINTILETDTKAKMEELKGNQHKIDKNKNNKIDAHDFKILRGEKKVEESSHQAKTTMKHVKNPTAGEKAAAKDIKPGIAGYRDRIDMLKSAEARGGLKKEEAEVVEEGIPGKKKPRPDRFHIAGSLASYPDKDSAIKDRDAKYPGAKVHQVGPRGKIKEETESVDEGKNIGGKPYDMKADLKGKSDKQLDALISSLKNKPASHADTHKMVAAARAERAGRIGKKGVAEEVEQFDEAKEPGFRASYGLGRKGTAAKKPETYGKRVTGKGYDKPENERKAPEGNVAMTSMMPGHDERAAKFLARQAKGTLVKGKAQSAKQMEKEEIDPKKTMTDTLKGREKDSSNPFLSKKVMMDVPDNVKEQTEHIDERTLTEPETTEKERIVKGMKKSLAGFKSRYGDRAKSVMYATATKAAKERK